MDSSRILLIMGFLLTIGSILLQLIGLASPYWLYLAIGEMVFYGGLWKSCTNAFSQGIIVCTELTNVEDYIQAVRAMSILGLLSLIVALGLVILKVFFIKDSKPILFAAIGSVFAGVLFVLISIAVFAAKADNAVFGIPFNYHFAFAFCIMGMLAAGAAGACLIAHALKTV